MRVLQVISSSTTSGAERHVFSLSQLLARHGHTVEIVCPPGGWLPQALHEAGLTVHVSDMKGHGWFRTTGLLLNKIKSGQFDVVHSHLTRATYFGAIAGLLRGIPAVATVHIANHDQIYKRMARGRNRLVAVSNYVRGMLHGRGIPDRYIDTVYNGTDFVDFEPHSPAETRQEFGLAPDKPLIGLVGRVCQEKGHLMMVEAMGEVIREHPAAHLMFVGRIEPFFEPILADALAAANIQDRVIMAGVRHDVPRLLDAFTLSAMPSHRETFGIAAIEAMARRRAVVASRIGGLPEVVHHGQTGLLVDLRPEELTEAVSYLLEHERERTEMGELGRRLVEEKFTLGEMVGRLENVYSRAISGSSQV